MEHESNASILNKHIPRNRFQNTTTLFMLQFVKSKMFYTAETTTLVIALRLKDMREINMNWLVYMLTVLGVNGSNQCNM